MRVRAIAAGMLVAWLGVSSAVGDGAATVTGSAGGAQRALVVVDRADDAGLKARSRTYTATAVDHNRDGDQDVFISYHARAAKLWRNRGNGNFRRVAASAWPKLSTDRKLIDRHNCAWADVDRNGRPDAYCSTGRFVANVVKEGRDNELWLQNRAGQFHDVGTDWGVGDVCGRGRQVTFLDANGDKFPDLFVGNDYQRKVQDPCNNPANHLPGERSKLFINTGGSGFRHDRRFWDYGAGPGNRCAEVLDFDGDGWDDLVTCISQNRTPRLYRNRGGRGFADVTSAHDLSMRVDDAVVADIDGDRDPDLVTAASQGFAYHLNTGGRFGPRVWIGLTSVGEGRSVAVGDVDGDGDRDVYGMVGNGQRSNPDDSVWLNDRLTFSPVAVPGAGGAADDVIALKPRDNGRVQFLVLNGFGRGDTPLGPIQLISLLGR